MVRREARAVEKILNLALDQTRDMARGLNPVKVKSDGLTSALQSLAANASVPAGPRCFCQIPASVKIPDHHVANHLYRIAQEAVQNALKHARAKNISITLGREDDRIVLAVKDDGVGIPVHLKKTGMGVENMHARARFIDGRLDIHRRKSGGTTVACEILAQKEERS
jgi:signal transduction histidine kinase